MDDLFRGKSGIEETLDLLLSIYPPVTPTPDDPIELIMYRAGQRNVIEYLQLYLQQNNV